MRRLLVELGDERRDVVLYFAFLGAALGMSALMLISLLEVGRLPYLT